MYHGLSLYSLSIIIINIYFLRIIILFLFLLVFVFVFVFVVGKAIYNVGLLKKSFLLPHGDRILIYTLGIF